MTAAAAGPARASAMAQLEGRPPGDGGGLIAGWWPWSIVAAAVAWNLVSLRAEAIPVVYLNDSSLHEQMVRVATAQLRAGHLPLTAWFPYLGLGSPQFLHYQSLPAILTGALGLLIGPDDAFRWTLYLLLSLWPVSVYVAARLLGGGRAAAAGAAAMAPFLVSATGVGYEQQAYVWTGYGVWTQLWASMTLPLAWGFGWQAIRYGRHRFAAVLLVALTCAFHFETGYLAFAPLIVWPLVAGQGLGPCARRAAVLVAGSLLAVAWVIVPLFAQRSWAATNEVLRDTALENGYGARHVLDWLVFGGLLDHGRIPVVTVFALVGIVIAGVRWRRDPGGRALLVALVVCLLLSFGRATFGDLIAVVPGSADIFFRRFMMGVQLAALLLAGRGAAWVATAVGCGLSAWRPPGGPAIRRAAHRWHGVLLAPAALAAAALVLFPAWRQLGSYDARNAAAIHAQQRADATEGEQLDRLIAAIGPDRGRVYAGMPSNWGAEFTVGAVPVCKYLESREIDEVGYTLRTASLMSDPEYYFDERNPGNDGLFGIHYLILPTGSRPHVPARLEVRAGPYSLWTRPGAGGVLHAGTIVGRLTANRTDIGTRTLPVLHSDLAQRGRYEQVRFDQSDSGVTARSSRSPTVPPFRGSAGTIVAPADHLTAGWAGATVAMRRPGVVVLSASFDPGWTATVDGKPQPTEMVAPALVATTVPAGTHRIVFRYRGFRWYPLLFAVSAGSLLALLGAELVRFHTADVDAPRGRPSLTATL